MMRPAVILFTLALALNVSAMEGTLRSTENAPVPYAYLGVLTSGFMPVTDAVSESDGSFSLAEPVEDGFLVVQPAADPDASGMRVFKHSPRLYELPVDAENLQLRLPPVGNLILEAYDADGKLLRWKDWQARGEYAGRFAYAVNLQDETFPHAVWPVHGSLTGSPGGPREAGVPALLVPPGKPVAVNMLFWRTQGYGKLLLKADNGGVGFELPKAGSSLRLLVNLELARTAVADLVRRKPLFAAEDAGAIDALAARLDEAAQRETAPEVAKAADVVLADALRLRDDLELARARRAWPEARQGSLLVSVTGNGDLGEAELHVKQDKFDFLFGAYEGAPFRAEPFQMAREAGFNLATVLLGWNWTNSPKLNKGRIDQTFGMSVLNSLDYTVKAHGVVWLQAYGILPDDAFTKKHDALIDEALAHQKLVMEVFGGEVGLWEAVNEPANTNVVNITRKEMIKLLKDAAENVKALDKPTIVNNPHEFSYGSQYLIYDLENEPVNGYPLTYSDFLTRASEEDALDQVDIIALQVYPGYHLNEEFAGAQGPAFTPSYLLDTVERYTRFGKTIHISEFSLPSSYGDDWFAGYWRERWNETVQADYAEAVFTMLFAHPQVESVGWWDMTDLKPSVLTGGLIDRQGAPKEALNRISRAISEWRTDVTAPLSESGTFSGPATAGAYTITVSTPDGRTGTATAAVTAGETTEVSITLN